MNNGSIILTIWLWKNSDFFVLVEIFVTIGKVKRLKGIAGRNRAGFVDSRPKKDGSGERSKSGEGGFRFTVQHNIRAVCVRARSGGVLHASPPRQPPPPPQDARARPLIGRHYSKWRLRHIRSVLLAYRERRRRRVFWWLAKNFAATPRLRTASPRDFRRGADSAAGPLRSICER